MAGLASRKEVAKRYIALLEAGDMEAIIDLFADDGTVQSPIYGKQSAGDFYRQLAADTRQSQLHIRDLFESAEKAQLALYFEYIWTLRSGQIVRFEVVDILKFDEENKIQTLTIIYDTVQSRQLVQELSFRSRSIF
ncbi:MAG: nuclear transport factor 2 family protein [Bacteroidota bacterium]